MSKFQMMNDLRRVKGIQNGYVVYEKILNFRRLIWAVDLQG